MSKENMLGTLEELCTTTLPAKIAAMGQANQLNRANYMSTVRYALNNVLIEIALGCSIEIKDGKTKIKFNKPIPSVMDLSKAASSLNKYMTDFENPLLERFKAAEQAANGGAGDMNVVPEVNAKKRILIVEKNDNKHLKNLLTQQGIMGVDIIDTADFLELAAIGNQARMKANITKAIIIGSAVLLVTGATVAGVMIYKHKKEQEELEEAMEDDIDISVEIDDMGTIPAIDNPRITRAMI